MSQFGNQSKSYLDQLLRQQRYNLTAIGYQQLVVGGTAVALTVPAGATYALIEVESDLTTPAIRYLELGDLTLPTASTGIRRSNLDGVDIEGRPNLENFRAIQISAGTHKLNVVYYR